MVKKNSQKLLLSLWSDERSGEVGSDDRLAGGRPGHSSRSDAHFAGGHSSHFGRPTYPTYPTQVLDWFLPDLTPSGRRSLVGHLERQGWLSIDKLDDQAWLRLTRAGTKALEEALPALAFSSRGGASQSSQWQLLIFHEAPRSDPNFRYLRTRLLAAKALPLSRGVYLFPTFLSKPILEECQALYQNSVVIVGVGEWRFSDERELVVDGYGLADLATAYSGVGKELGRLLASYDRAGRLNDRLKQGFFTAFDRFWEVLVQDLGLVTTYFPQVPSPQLILKDFQQVLANY